MKIALDASYSLDRDLSGVGVYSLEMLEGLAAAHPEARFQFCYRAHRLARSFGTRLPGNAKRFLLAENRAPQSADIFHALNQRLPRARPRHTIVTFHDLFVLTGEYSTREFRERFAGQARDAAARAEHIITVSHFTARQVSELLGVGPERIHVVHHGVRPAPARAVRREKIVLHVGAIQLRKNIARLVDAFEKLDREWQLVLAGSQGYGAYEILSKIEAADSRDRIRVLGYVPARELGSWYQRAMIFAFPSLDEGFGMPVLEAMASGTPVIASNRSAIPEVAGDAAWLVNPEDTEELASALVGLSKQDERREELARRGLARAGLFTWDAAVEKTWQVYVSALGGAPD